MQKLKVTRSEAEEVLKRRQHNTRLDKAKDVANKIWSGLEKGAEVAGNITARTRAGASAVYHDPLVKKGIDLAVRAGRNQAYSPSMGAFDKGEVRMGNSRRRHKARRASKPRRRRAKRKGQNFQIKPGVAYVQQQAPQAYTASERTQPTVSMDNYPNYP